MLLQIPELLNAEELAWARVLLRDAPWADGRGSAGTQAVRVKNNQQLPRECRAATEIRAMVLQALDRNPMFFSAALPKRVFTPHVNRYGGDANTYGEHVDNAIRFAPDTGLRIRTDLSATVFLCDPDDYDGGELVVGQGPDAPRIRLPAGHMVLYPGTSVHQVTPVTRGERLACFFWVESMVRELERRELLFQLDMAILDLRTQHGDGDETVRLTGCYHNLLRMWADT